jgi:hypothetical protein
MESKARLAFLLFLSSSTIHLAAGRPTTSILKPVETFTPSRVRLVNGTLAAVQGFCIAEVGGPCDDIQNCANFLRDKGETRCEVEAQGRSAFCESDRIRVIAASTTGRPESSFCSDVAHAVQWVVDNCNNGGNCAGRLPL